LSSRCSLEGETGGQLPSLLWTWQLTNQNTIQVSWNDIQATLRRGSTDDLWRGKMESSSDDGRVYPGPGISVRRVDDAVCDPKAL
jgi:hypothetical protein